MILIIIVINPPIDPIIIKSHAKTLSNTPISVLMFKWIRDGIIIDIGAIKIAPRIDK